MIFNLTPHAIHVYNEAGFVNLEQVNPTTWVADGVNKDELLASFESIGCARINVSTVPGDSIEMTVSDREELVGAKNVKIPTVRTTYGELTGVPELALNKEDLLVVSLPTQNMAKMSGHVCANQMVTPYKVVRNRANTSEVLGCCGFSFQ